MLLLLKFSKHLREVQFGTFKADRGSLRL